jgi:SRSO17 transposase
MLGSDLYLPRSWANDRERCRAAGIPDDLRFRTKWQIGLDQVRRAIGNGVRFSYLVFDSDYGRVPKFWFALDAMGQRGVGGVGADFPCWTRLPRWRSGRAEHASKRADHLVTHSPAFTQQAWRTVRIKMLTRGQSVWRLKAARVHLVAQKAPNHHGPAIPTDRHYWLLAAENVRNPERKYFVSNAAAEADPEGLLRVALARHHVEKWFERAKQEAGFGAFEVRTYASLIRHWLCSRLAMLFLASQTRRLRGEKSAHHVRTGRRRDQHASREELGPLVPILDRDPLQSYLLPTTQ